MKDENVIEVKDVYKKFKSYFDKSNNLKEKMLHKERNKFQEHWVLNGISFNVKKGEAVGLIGCNGCGKSTTLKLLTKIIYPDRGTIEIDGRVSSLLELGAGFHPDLSGYENIYLNAAVFGLTRKEIDKRVEEIIRFSELREFINNPIRTYSSGMYMKLAFSVAINVDADILLIDEILGVGDVNFQQKCFEKLIEIKNKGTTIVIVSHSTDQIEKICDRSIWIENGGIREEGIPIEVDKDYLETMAEKRIVQKKKEEIEAEIEAEYKKKIEEISKLNKEQRKRERDLLEQRKKERERLRRADEENSACQGFSLDLLNKEHEEEEKQKKLIESAEKERKKQESVQNSFKLEEIPEEEIWVEYYKKETNRLELVVQEKNIENERLNSVITQKDILLMKREAEWKEDLFKNNQVVIEKDNEIDRLNEVILEKDEEIDRLNRVILEKELEIKKMVKL